MRRYWTAYWKKSTAQRNIEEGHHFDHTGTARHFEVAAGDIVYGITNVKGILHVLGRMEVGERVSAKRAEKLLGYSPWPADEHLVAASGAATGIYLNRRLDPNNPDTDGDGLTDGDEVRKYGTNPPSPSESASWSRMASPYS